MGQQSQSTFGGWLRKRRTELGITRADLAEQLGFSFDLLRKLESGLRRPSGQIAQLLADRFHIPTDEREAFITFARAGAVTILAPAPGSADPDLSNVNAANPWRRAYVQRTNLPAVLTPLVGRVREREVARDLILHPKTRLLTLTGAPGIGKTRLGLQLASDLVGQFDDGVFMVDLAPVADPGLVLSTVAHTLGLAEESGPSPEDALFEHVRERKILLFLDNFEQVLDAAPAVVRLMLASPWLKIVVTSREALHVRGERRYPVPPLGTPESWETPPLQQLAEFPAVRLFAERAQAVEPDFILNESNAATVVEICRRLGGLPLSIELIAARIRVFSPDLLLAQLARVGDLEMLKVTGGAWDLPARHKSLGAAIAWSYNLLAEEERALFRRLGVFVSGCTPESAGFVHQGKYGPSLFIVKGIASLLDKSLLSKIEERVPDLRREPRFVMLETIREYALEQLGKEGELEESQRRHALFFMELAEQAEPELKGPEQAMWLTRLEREYSNIQAALEWALDYDAEITVRLMFALRRFRYIRNHYAESESWLGKVLALGNSTLPVIRAKALFAASDIAYHLGDIDRGASYLEESIALARRAGDKRLLAVTQSQHAYQLLERGDDASAKSLFEACLALNRELDDKYGICWLLNALGEVARWQGDYVRAQAYYAEGLLLAREAHNIYNMAHLVGNLAWLALGEGDADRSRPLIEESLALARQVGYTLGTVGCLACMAAMCVVAGSPERGARLSGAIQQLQQALGTEVDALDRRLYELYMDAARGQLGEVLFAEEQTAGRAMSMEEAIEYALEQN